MSTSIHLLSTTYTDIHLYRCMYTYTGVCQVSMPQFIERQLEKLS